MKLNSILVLDDSKVDLEIVSMACRNLDCEVESFSDPVAALKRFQERKHDVVLVDYMMEPMDGIDFISLIRGFEKSAYCIVMTGFPDEKIRNYACDMNLPPIITKPIRPNHFTEILRMAINRHRGATQVLEPVAISNRMDDCIALLGQSDAICGVRKSIYHSLKQKKPIFIEGPYGVGKPDVIRFIHEHGPYANSRLIHCQCHEFSPDEMPVQIITEEGEYGLCLREAIGATIIFKRIDAVPLYLQKALAKAIRELSDKCMILGWANESLDTLLEDGRIDESLYCELSMQVIHLPPLNDRPIDLEEIVRYICAAPDVFDLGRKMDAKEVDILVAEMRRFELKGNLRELCQRIRLFSLQEKVLA